MIQGTKLSVPGGGSPRPAVSSDPAFVPANRFASRSLFQPPAKDTVRFGSTAGPLAAKYGIDPANVDIVNASGVPLPCTKADLVERLIEAHEQAKKNKLLGNFSGFQRASNMLLANGTWAVATNIELTRDNILCGERSATVAAWNKALTAMPLSDVENAAKQDQLAQGLKVKLLAMAEGGSPIRKGATPCSECLSWLETQKYFGPDTLTATLQQDEATGRLKIELKSMQELLPFLNQQVPSLSSQPVGKLPVSLSHHAKAALQSGRISTDTFTALMQQAQQAYAANKTAALSAKNTGAAVKLSTGQTYTGARFDWTRRWFEGAELSAAARGIQAQEKALAQGKPVKVQAVAYYGDAIAPDTRSLGILAQPGWGGPDTLIAVIENDRIEVRTVQDYIAAVYVSKPNPTAK